MKAGRFRVAIVLVACAMITVVQCGGDKGAPSDGGARDANTPAPGRDAATSCPAAQPSPGARCTSIADCTYGRTLCTCIDPGPNGVWECEGPRPDAGPNPAACPRNEPNPGDPCGDAGMVEGCRYDDLVCSCDREGWDCII